MPQVRGKLPGLHAQLPELQRAQTLDVENDFPILFYFYDPVVGYLSLPHDEERSAQFRDCLTADISQVVRSPAVHIGHHDPVQAVSSPPQLVEDLPGVGHNGPSEGTVKRFLHSQN